MLCYWKSCGLPVPSSLTHPWRPPALCISLADGLASIPHLLAPRHRRVLFLTLPAPCLCHRSRTVRPSHLIGCIHLATICPWLFPVRLMGAYQSALNKPHQEHFSILDHQWHRFYTCLCVWPAHTFHWKLWYHIQCSGYHQASSRWSLG